MGRKEDANQEVSVALELLDGTLQEEKTRIWRAGVEAMQRQDGETAQSVLDFVKKLDDFGAEVRSLVDKWNGLLQIRRAATPAVRRIVTGDGRLFSEGRRKAASGFTRTLAHPLAPRTNFEIRFPDGTAFLERKACDTFLKAIQRIGLKQVFDLGIRVYGEPLVARERSRKYPSASKAVPGGYYILTHSSTAGKVAQLARIGKLLGLGLEIRTCGSAPLRKTQD